MSWFKESFDTAFSTIGKTALCLFTGIVTVGCLPQNAASLTSSSTFASASPTPTSTSSSTSSVRAVRIYLQASTTTGATASFDLPTDTNGTVPGFGTGWPAVRVFDTSGSATQISSAGNTATGGGPPWLQRFELGLSGPKAPTAPNSACARFSDPSESSFTNCNLGNLSLNSCGAGSGQFRISEADCYSQAGSPTGIGIGASADPIYLRAVFDRTQLASTENILVVLDYAATGLSPGIPNPSACFSGSGTTPTFAPEYCADFVWRSFLNPKGNTGTPQPFFLLVPPVFSSILVYPAPLSTPTNSGASTTISSKQFILPLATDSNLSVFQISRTGANPRQSYFNQLGFYCNANHTTEANAPFCSGIVFYAISFYRI